MTVSRNLYTLRKTYGLSLQYLSEQTGITPTSLSAYEKGKYLPSLENICRLADFYQVSLEELIRGNVC